MAIDSVIFGFGYRARSGKDTAVAEIIKQRGLLPVGPQEDGYTIGANVNNDRYDIRKYSFADALRSEVDAEYRKAGSVEKVFSPDYCFAKKGYVVTLPEWVQYDPNGEVNEQYPRGKQRSFLQWWGTEYRRSDDDNYWVKRLAEQIELEKPQIALITDMRFPNEMSFVLQYGETVRVDRAGLPPSTHASETALQDVSDEDWSIILENNGTLEEFLEGAVTAFDELLLNFPQQRNVRQALGV
jgi:hypothetical protein